MIANLKPYPAIKDSGVEWLGDVPEHWDTSKIKGLARPGYKTFVDGDWIESPHITADGIRLIQTGNIGTGEYREKGFRYISEETFTNFGCTEIKPGDVLICRLGKPVARACLAPQLGKRMVTSVDVCILKTRENIHAKFLVYSMSSWPYLDWVGSLVRGSTRDRVSRSMLGSFLLPLPPLPEQAAIVRFLDHADRRIRRYIRAKQKLIKLLEEQEQAIIHQTVTGQVDVRTGRPYPVYKNSGVEWLGKVPAHWEVRRVKQAAQILRGKFTHRPRNDPSLYDGLYPFIQTGEVARAERAITSYRQTLNERGLAVSRMFPAGTLVMTIAANIGDVAVLDFGACFPDSVVGFVPRNDIERDFLYYVFRAMRPELLREAPVNTQGNLNVDRIGSRGIAIAPAYEQRLVVRQIEASTAELNTVTNRARREISLLREYHTRLIADVVTGKLDVRKAAGRLPDEVEEQELLDETDALIDGDGATDDDLDTTPEEATV